MRLPLTPKSISAVSRALPRDEPAVQSAADQWGEWMVAAQGGHGGAYHRLLGEIAEWLRRYFRRRLPSDVVDDAVQETLLAVHRRRHTYDPQYPLGIWLAAIARHKWIDQLRCLERRPSSPLSDNLSVADHEATVISASVLVSLLDGLRPAQARVISLVKLHGYSIEEAASATGLSPSAVKMNIHRGLSRLSTILERTPDVD